MRQAITWITTDWHLNHNRIVELCGRPTDYESKIIRNHRMLVQPQDTLVNLGDLIFYDHSNIEIILASIPCRHVLILGNHDQKSKSWYINHGFSLACDGLVIDDILLTHKPVDPGSVARINIHGHWHNLGDRIGESKGYDPGRHRLLAIENTNYCPVRLREFAAPKE